jgi:prepilin-type N-terminal cleavage/methylation domain-containing protein
MFSILTNRLRPLHRRLVRGFSLIEVVVAVGIFSVAITIVIGLLAPTVKSVASTLDNNAANRLATAINAKLTSLGFTAVVTGDTATTVAGGLLITLAAAADINDDTQTTKYLYASKAGDKIGLAIDPIWTTGLSANTSPNADKFFEIMLVRNTALSPNVAPNLDTNAGAVAFTVRITWPAYLPDGNGPTPRVSRSVFQYNSALPR